MEHTFTLPIGDWSGDGHGKCNYYTVTSNKSVEEVREIHFKIKEKFGFDPTTFARDYEDNSIPGEVADKLIELGFNEFTENVDELEEGGGYACAETMVYIWLFLLMQVDDTLKLEMSKGVPMLPFYGFDSKKRHIDFVGYGCFY